LAREGFAGDQRIKRPVRQTEKHDSSYEHDKRSRRAELLSHERRQHQQSYD
jgi:hypothetical protein